jgi:hypothetical protein
MPSQSSNGRRRKQETPRHYVYVPKTLNAADVLRVLRPRFQAQGQGVWHLVDLVARKMNSDGDPVPLHNKILGNILGQKNAKTILDACVQHGVLVTDGKHKRGEKCREYRLGDQFEDADFVARELTDPYLIARIDKAHEKARGNLAKPHLLWESRQEKSLGINKPLADAILRDMPAGKDNYRNQSRLIDDIAQRRFWVSIDPRGRLYNNCCSLKSAIREAILLNGVTIEGLDISNSQPALLGLLMTQKGISGIDDYVGLAGDGILYDYVAHRGGFTRDYAKERLLIDVFGKKGKYPSELANVFESLFPPVFGFVQDFNEDNHAALLLELQRVEANLVIWKLGLALPETYPAFPHHDAVYFPKGEEQTIRTAFAQILNGYPIHLEKTVCKK